MPSVKNKSTMDKAINLISSLLDVTSSQDMPFANSSSSYNTCIWCSFPSFVSPSLLSESVYDYEGGG